MNSKMITLAVFLLGTAMAQDPNATPDPNAAPQAPASVDPPAAWLGGETSAEWKALIAEEPWWPTCASFKEANPDSTQPCTNPWSFMNMSPNYQNWEQRYPMGALIGFVLWGLAFVTTVGIVFHDIKKRMEGYKEKVENDIHTLKELDIGQGRWSEIENELAVRLQGKELEEKGDDQLLGEAAKLSEGEYRSNLGR